MFSCIRLRKPKQCCEPKIGGETPVTSNLSSGSSMDQIQYMAMCKRSIMWYCSHGLLSSSFGMGMVSFWNTPSWWTFPLFEAWGTSNEVEIYWLKHGSNSVHGNVWKKYYVILLPWTLVIFFWDGHGIVLKHSILMNVPFVWGMRDIKKVEIYDTKTSQ